MPWTIVFHEERPEKPKVGDMWPAPWLVEDEDGPRAFFLSDAFLARWDKGERRMPLVVRMPDGTDFCVDSPTFANGKRGSGGWAVSGTPPKITLAPSINLVGFYHGYIIDGVITDDVEGRKFPSQG